MKLIGSLVVIASLVFGVLCAATAYLPRLSLADEQLLGLTLNAPAGGPPPLARPGDVLTPELLATLRANGVERVRVKEFAFARWSHAWWFALAVVTLTAGGLTVKQAARMQYAAPAAGAQRESPASSAREALARIREIASALADELPRIADEHERCRTIVHRLDEVQRRHALTIVDAKPALIAGLGMAGFAEFMDHFSAGERNLNRAWSAAADNHAPEAERSLDAAHAPLAQAASMLGA